MLDLEKELGGAVLNWLSNLNQKINLDKYDTLYSENDISNLGIGDNISLTIMANKELYNNCNIEIKNYWGINLPNSNSIVTSGNFRIIDIINNNGITRYLLEPLNLNEIENKKLIYETIQKYCKDILKKNYSNFSFKEWRENIWKDNNEEL